MANFYELLDLTARQADATLSPTEVKAAYRRALLLHHPDKRRQPSAIQPSSTKIATAQSTKRTASVDEIALAYKTLSEPGLRAEYDRQLRLESKAQFDSASSSTSGIIRHTGLETVDLDDLAYDAQAGDRWRRSCRCGHPEAFIVTEAELERNVEDGELIVGCKGCSLWLRVLFSVDE